MGWLFRADFTRKDLIAENTKNWEQTNPEGTTIKSACIAHCFRGGAFSGVLWSVWERTFLKDGQPVQPMQRWICCDLMRYQREDGWGSKDMDESMHPYYYSCPLSYLDLVPIDQFGGKPEWRDSVRNYHARIAEKRRTRRACQAS